MTRHSLRWKLTASYLLLVVVALAVVAICLVPSVTRFYVSSYERDTLNKAVVAARILATYRADGASLNRLDQVATDSSWRDGAYIGVRGTDGQPLSTSR